MRWRENKKSNPGTEKRTDKTPTTTESPTFNKRRKLMDLSAGQLAEAEYQLHLTEIQKEWQKPAVKRSETHIKGLLKETFQNRRQWIGNLPDATIRPIVDKFPCLQDGTYVSNALI